MVNVKHVRRRPILAQPKSPLRSKKPTKVKSNPKSKIPPSSTAAAAPPRGAMHTVTPTVLEQDRNRSVSPPSGISDVPPGRVPIFSELGKVIAWTRPEWIEQPLYEKPVASVTWVNDDGTVERRPVSPELAKLDTKAEERILGFGEYGVSLIYREGARERIGERMQTDGVVREGGGRGEAGERDGDGVGDI